MTRRLIAPALAMCFTLALCLKYHTAQSSIIRERCQCLNTVDAVKGRRISDFKVIEKSSICKNDQIIITFKSGKQVCLNPNKAQGRKLKKCWKRFEEKKRCFQRNGQKKNRKQKKSS
ncbi:growth-regulated protein homolog gamma-like [Polypterus senegalus]|uniref:growth-regulated protein homolog gamma-like n=1 Tax=Polypterus senegalus TaxID=55291 RepID=UPI001965EB74|nr:growth-regulated protein homolog gamma-like [Polypterus senegalus]